MVLIVFLAANTARLVDTQRCESASVETYVQRRSNVTRTVINNIHSIAGNLAFNVSRPTTQPGATNEEALYDSLTATFDLEKSNSSFATFRAALTTITEAYFEACHGPADSQPRLAEASVLIQRLFSDLGIFTTGRNQSLLAIIRETFGRLMCLKDKATNQGPRSARAAPNCRDSSVLTLEEFEMCFSATQLQSVFGLDPLVRIGNMIVQSRRCVGFVVDDTGSMSDEIAAVRTNILRFIDAERDLPACYVMVTFNDFEDSDPVGST